MRRASLADKTVAVAAERPEKAEACGRDGREQHQQLTVAEALAVPRCPCCRAPLVVRMSCRGPYFQCLCEDCAER
jgi:hypothetical protein